MLFPDDPQFSQEYARARLAPIQPRLLACVQRAWQTLEQICGVADTVGAALAHNGARATLMNSLVVEEIRREFPPLHDPECTPFDGNGFLELQARKAGDPVRIDLRFKKFGSDGATMNLDTPAQREYRNQLAFTGIGDASHVLRLSISWCWDAAATELQDIRVIYLKGYETEWFYSMLGDADEGSAGIPMPAPAVPPSSGTRYRKAADTSQARRSEGSA